MENKKFGEILKIIRESRGMTVNQLAMYSGISGASISRYETGTRGVPKPPTIKKLADALKYPYNDLLIAAGHIESSEDAEKPSGIYQLGSEQAKLNVIREIEEKYNINLTDPEDRKVLEEALGIVKAIWERSKK